MKEQLNVLVACEESQTVCKAFREIGHRAFSCDLQDCSGGHPEWHVMGDCLPLLDGNCDFTTCDGKMHHQEGEWDILVAHPPCTYMSKAGARWLFKCGTLNQERYKLAMEGKEFFMKMLNAKCHYIAVENPQPMKVIGLPKPSTVVQPYEFGSPYSKKTYLWLINLPPIMPTAFMAKYEPYLPSNVTGQKRGQKWSRGVAHNAKDASKTFPGIAKAMAEQWSEWVMNEK